MSPIYAVTSFLSLVFPVADGYLAVIKDFYEGACVERPGLALSAFVPLLLFLAVSPLSS
jgi:hypothetical protein